MKKNLWYLLIIACLCSCSFTFHEQDYSSFSSSGNIIKYNSLFDEEGYFISPYDIDPLQVECLIFWSLEVKVALLVKELPKIETFGKDVDYDFTIIVLHLFEMVKNNSLVEADISEYIHIYSKIYSTSYSRIEVHPSTVSTIVLIAKMFDAKQLSRIPNYLSWPEDSKYKRPLLWDNFEKILRQMFGEYFQNSME